MIIKDKLRFEWDQNKDLTNQKKHYVSFKDALTVFRDEEERFILIGISKRAEILVVVHCLRDSGSTIRIISARKATKAEKKQYFQRKRNGQ